MPAPKPTDEELATLTDEERDALLDDTIVDEGEVTDTGVTAVIPDDENVLLPDEDKEGDGDPSGDEPAAGGDGDAKADRDASPTPPAASTPALPERRDFGREIGDLRQQQRDLAAQFDAGDLSAADYETQRQALEDKIFDAKSDQRDALKADDDLETNFLNRAVPSFIEQHPAYAPGSARFFALNGHVQALQNAAIAAAGGDERAQYNPDFLKQAFDKVEKELGPTTRASVPDLKDPASRELPPNLGSAPAAAGDDDITTNGRWAALDRLSQSDPEAYERELAKLSEADQAAYLAAQ